MILIEAHFRHIASYVDWLDDDRLDLSNFDGAFERGQFLERSCRVNEDFSAHNFLMGRNSFYHCRTQMPNNVLIGRHCSVNSLALIGAVSHNVNNLSTGMLDIDREARDVLTPTEIFESFLPTIIGCDVWVGANAVILHGCTIGHGACVAAGAVVTKSVPPYAIVGGVPARILKYRFDAVTRGRLLSSRWWELPQSIVAELPFRNVEAALTIVETYWKKKSP